MGTVHHLRDVRIWRLPIKTRPTASCIEFGGTVKQRFATPLAVIGAFSPLRIEFAGVRTFGAIFAHHAVLFVRELGLPLFGRQVHDP